MTRRLLPFVVLSLALTGILAVLTTLALLAGRALGGAVLAFEANTRIWVADARTGVLAPLVRAGAVGAPSWTPDARTFAYAASVPDAGFWDIFVQTPPAAPRRLTRAAVPDYAPSFSPDGRWMVYNARDLLLRMDADGGGTRTVLDFSLVGSDSPVWSADGTQIGARVSAMSNFVPYRVNADGSGAQLVSVPQGVDTFSWSPDLAYLAFPMNDVEGGRSVYAAVVPGGAAQRLSDLPGEAGTPAWSPDGGRLAFTVNAGGAAADLYLLDVRRESSGALAPGTPRLLSRLPPGAALSLLWSPDGALIGCLLIAPGWMGVYLLDSGTGTQQRAWTLAANYGGAGWMP